MIKFNKIFAKMIKQLIILIEFLLEIIKLNIFFFCIFVHIFDKIQNFSKKNI